MSFCKNYGSIHMALKRPHNQLDFFTFWCSCFSLSYCVLHLNALYSFSCLCIFNKNNIQSWTKSVREVHRKFIPKITYSSHMRPWHFVSNSYRFFFRDWISKHFFFWLTLYEYEKLRTQSHILLTYVDCLFTLELFQMYEVMFNNDSNDAVSQSN